MTFPNNSDRLPERSPSAPRAGRREPHRDEITLVTSAPGATPQTLVFRVNIPSSRVRVSLGIGWFGQAAPDVSTSSADFTPVFQDKLGDESPLPNTLTGQTLPYSLEVATAADAYIVTVTAVRPAGTLRGKLKAVAKWEPTNEMGTDEWESVKQSCTMMALTSCGGGIGI